ERLDGVRSHQSFHHPGNRSRLAYRGPVAHAVRGHGRAARSRRSGRRSDRPAQCDPRAEGIMRVFVAGGTGAIGVPLVRQLVAGGHQVTALTRSNANAATLRALGATPAVADALDALALRRVVADAKPTHVIHQLTALPKGGPRSPREVEPTNRLRIDGTRNLIEAAVAAGAKRIVVGSFAFLRGAPSADRPPDARALEAVRSMESQTLDANRSGRIEGVVLRYGLFYGPETGSTAQMIAMARRRMLPTIRDDRSLLSNIHVDDAASATVAALDRAPAGSVYDIVDDR